MQRRPATDAPLPIDALRADFVDALARGPVVLTSPTGSGKSTQVPRWCPAPVLVIEPRRIACRALAARVAQLEGTSLGDGVGYHVRDERRAHDDTRVLFVTPGIALRLHPTWSRFASVVVDEFHERSLETDLLVALLARAWTRPLVVMSATVDGDRVAAHLRGAHLRGEARTFPVSIQHLADGPSQLPSPNDLEDRVLRALARARDLPGDALVFLPGKQEIAACARALRERSDLEVLPLHGDLSLDEQRRVFSDASRRRVVLATNVAETSLTLPGVGVVIDSGLARQTRYRDGRSSLVLAPIAQDSADQRAGRAGRTGPGAAIRLWSPDARLAPRTLPEVHRASLVPLVLGAAACGATPEDLPLLDPPKPSALADAREELVALGALADNTLTPRGRELWSLPMDPALGRLLVEARAQRTLDPIVDLVAALSASRSLFLGPPSDDPDDLRRDGCDLLGLVRAVRYGTPSLHELHAPSLDEARRTAERLRRSENAPAPDDPRRPIDREALVRTVLSADPRCAYVPRDRGRERAFSNGGTELLLGRESALSRVRDLEAAVVLATHASGEGRDAVVRITAAGPVSLRALEALGLGRDQLTGVTVHRGAAVATIDRVYARKTLSSREEPPVGDLAREAVVTLFLRGSIFRDALPRTRERLEALALATRLVASGHPSTASWSPLPRGSSDLEAWVRERVAALGVNHGDDLKLLSAEDLTADELPAEVTAALDREFPRSVKVGDASYRVTYDLARRQVTLSLVAGNRKDPPPAAYLPRFSGFRVCVEVGRSLVVLRPS